MRSAVAAGFLLVATQAAATDIIDAQYGAPTSRYAHGVLGDAIEWGALEMRGGDGTLYRINLPESRVFEDVAPRLFDVDGDGDREVIVVEADATRGARLAIYDSEGLVAANDYIGTRFRWLAPIGVGAADLDGDGQIELAFVDRPHLAKTLRVYRFSEGELTLIGSLPGVTNHRIGEPDIAGGIRDCGKGPEMVVASADWRRVLSVTFDGTGFDIEDIGPHSSRLDFAEAMDACR